MEKVIKVEGMACNACENRVQNALKEMNGVEEVKASHENGTVTIKGNDNMNIEEISSRIEDLGYDVIK